MIEGVWHADEPASGSANPDFFGRVTVPVLWDKKRQTIVNNESSGIIRMLNSAFDKVGARGPDLYPVPIPARRIGASFRR